MTDERWHFLMAAADADAVLTDEEFAEGWHWCLDWDELLVGPGMGEQEFCLCRPKQ